MDNGAGEEPGGWPGVGLIVEEGKREREESRPTCRRSDSFMDSLSRSLVLTEEGERDRDRERISFKKNPFIQSTSF